MKLELWIGFVSRRWFSARRESGGSAASVLAAAGIGVGVAALVVVLGVMNGFQLGFIESILEVSSFHVLVEDERAGPPDASLISRLGEERGVLSVLPFSESRCLIAAPDGRVMPLSVRSLPNDAAEIDPRMARAIGLEGPLFGARIEGDPGIVLGSELARYLGLTVGSRVELIAVYGSGEEGAVSRTARLRVERVFRSGYYDFDFGLAFMSFEDRASAFPSAGPVLYSYGIKLRDRFADAPFVARLSQGYGLGPGRVQGWREYNRAFFGALRTEKTVMMILVGLIFAVVGVNIYHAMRRAVAEKTEDIAVLRATGASPEAVRRAFVLDGLAVGAAGAAAGLIVGLLIAVNVNEVFAIAEAVVNGLSYAASRLTRAGASGNFRVFSPQYFYLMEVPVRVLFPETFFVAAAAVAAAGGAAAAASARVSRLSPLEALRDE